MSRLSTGSFGGWCLLALAVSTFASNLSAAEERLANRIDQLIAKRAAEENVPLAERTSDAEFLRRVMLDLNGRIPTAEEVTAFLADTSADKRETLINRLLDNPDYVQRMTDAFDVMLMERRGAHPEWTRFLEASFAANKPWDAMVREMLKADEESETSRGAAYFITKRLEKYGQNPTDYPGLTRDVGRLLLGVDLQCAQCHDHPQVDAYKQIDFQGLYIVFLNTFIRNDVPFPAVGENLLTKKLDYQSVFIQTPEMVGPRLPFGMEAMIPQFPQGEEYLVPPDKKTRSPGIPKFSPLGLLAEQLPVATNPQFTNNIANRLWFLMMGRGLIDPLDLMHPDNPPSHPELLELLAEELASHGFDMKWMLREIALSESYQRSSLIPEGADAPAPQTFAVALEKPLSAEQLMISMMQATGEKDLRIRQIDNDLRAADPKFFDILQANPDQLKAAREEKLAAVRKSFLEAFANEPMDPEVEFAPTVKAALFVSNEATIIGWIQPKKGNLVDRLLKTDDPEQLANILFLNVLSRSPSPQEVGEVTEYLSRRADRRERAVSNLVWALLASTEFRVNH